MNKTKNKIGFTDLSIWLKIPIIVSWIFGILYLLIFMLGFFKGFLGL